MSIEEDYESYREQISEDSLPSEKDEELSLMLRKGETQQLF